MKAVISLQRYGDGFSTYYGEFTRMHLDKFNSPYVQSQVCLNMAIWQYGNMAQPCARRELWSRAGRNKKSNK